MFLDTCIIAAFYKVSLKNLHIFSKLEDFRADKEKRHDHEMVAAHNGLYLNRALPSCKGNSISADLSETAVPGHNQKGKSILEFFGERSTREGTHVSRSYYSFARW